MKNEWKEDEKTFSISVQLLLFLFNDEKHEWWKKYKYHRNHSWRLLNATVVKLFAQFSHIKWMQCEKKRLNFIFHERNKAVEESQSFWWIKQTPNKHVLSADEALVEASHVSRLIECLVESRLCTIDTKCYHQVFTVEWNR